jgi:hypothetical protein
MLTALLIITASLAAPESPSVRAVKIDGTTLNAQWSGVAPDGILLHVAGQPQSIAPADLMYIRWDSAASLPATQPANIAGRVLVYLSDGSRLRGQITAADAREFELATRPAPHLKLPLAGIAAIRYAAPFAEGEDLLSKALANRSATEDTLLAVRDGRVNAIHGAIESITPAGGAFRWRQRSVPIRAESTYAIVYAPAARPASAAGCVCTLRDTSAWAGRLTGGTPTTVQLELAAGPTVSLPLQSISEIRFHSDRVLFLSDLEPAAYDFEPFASTRWPYRRDRSVANRPMQIAAQSFERGIGMHSQSRLTFDLPARYAQLAASIGIDDAARPRGSVVFRVLADGREVFTSGNVTGKDAPRPILVPLGGAKHVQLAVDFGEDLDVGDQADWGNVRVIK